MSGINLDRTNLSHASLSGVNLNGAFLREVNLHHADMVGVSLSNAILENSDLSEANLNILEADKGTLYLSQLGRVRSDPRIEIHQEVGIPRIEIHQEVGINRGRVIGIQVGSFHFSTDLSGAD